MRLVDKITERR